MNRADRIQIALTAMTISMGVCAGSAHRAGMPELVSLLAGWISGFCGAASLFVPKILRQSSPSP